jgi:hypothetical protein
MIDSPLPPLTKMEESSPHPSTDVTDVLYAQLSKNLEAGKNLGDALLNHGEEAMDIFFLGATEDWMKDLPSAQETSFRKILRSLVPFIKFGPPPLR